MTKHDDQVAQLVSPALSSGEQLIATTLVEYNGTIASNAVSIDVAMAQMTPGDDQLPPPDPDKLVSFPSAPMMALALTNRRLLVVSVGLSGKPKTVLGVVPLTAVTRIESLPGGYGPQMRVVMKSGALVDLEHRRGEPAAEFTERFVDAVKRVNAASQSPEV